MTWAIYRPDGPASVVAGGEAGGGPAPWAGTVPLAALAVLAPVLGWTGTAAVDAVRAARATHADRRPDRRPDRPPDHADAPDAGPVRPRHTGTALVGLAALVAGIVAGGVVTHQRTQAADRLEAAGSAFRYSEVVALATAVPTPAGAVEQTGTACHVLGKVRCWSIRRPFADVERELTSSLAVATGRAPSTLWRPTDVRFPGGDAVRTAVDVDGYRIEVEVMAMSTGSGRTATPTGEQSVHLSVYPVTWS